MVLVCLPSMPHALFPEKPYILAVIPRTQSIPSCFLFLLVRIPDTFAFRKCLQVAQQFLDAVRIGKKRIVVEQFDRVIADLCNAAAQVQKLRVLVHPAECQRADVDQVFSVLIGALVAAFAGLLVIIKISVMNPLLRFNDLFNRFPVVHFSPFLTLHTELSKARRFSC